MTAGHFSDPKAVETYAASARRQVPGLDLMHALVEQVLAESVPVDGRVLVVGAGGGIELANLAGRHDGWRFDGVDPSAEMLGLATATMGELADHATLHEGYVDDAPDGPFDAATCLLTLHFLPADERLRTLREIRRRLRPGAPLVTFHHSAPAGDERLTWLGRFAEFGVRSGNDPALAARSVEGLASRLPMLTPEEDEALLTEAGFTGIGTFYAALTFRGWIAYA